MNSKTSTFISFIDEYLRLSEERNLDQAKQRWGRNRAHIVVPGGTVIESMLDLVEWARTQYLWVKKDRTHYNCEILDDQVVVVSRGTLCGQELDGTHFNGVRYIDFFVIRDGEIVEQHIWNDLVLHLNSKQ